MLSCLIKRNGVRFFQKYPGGFGYIVDHKTSRYKNLLILTGFIIV